MRHSLPAESPDHRNVVLRASRTTADVGPADLLRRLPRTATELKCEAGALRRLVVERAEAADRALHRLG